MIAAKPVQNLTESFGISTSLKTAESPQWQAQLRDGIGSTAELLQAVALDEAAVVNSLGLGAPLAQTQFPTRVPRSFVRRMKVGDPLDPLLLQVLPLAAENQIAQGFSSDPVADLEHSPVPGLIHKYRTRVLLISTGACAVHCRYCFRREYPYENAAVNASQLDQVVRYIASQPLVNEVILSGGDPLSLSNARLRRISEALRELPQIKRLRIHTRTPIVLPSRVDAGFLAWLHDMPWPIALVLHSNHAQEWLDKLMCNAIGKLKAAGCTLLNQAVLLRRVNDTLTAQVELAETLFANGVLPYYLNQLDQVNGSAHFAVSDAEAIALHSSMRAALPGFMLPKLVQDRPGEAAKTQLTEAQHARTS